jgi:nucleoside-diphosphate-sugar epimerase
MLYRNNSIVITGSSGFVGRKLALTLINQGFKVIGIDTHRNNDLDCKQLELDLAEDDFFLELPENAILIHLAALSTDSACREDPITAIDANIRATSRVLENVRKAKAAHFIFASSEWVYPESNSALDQKESDSLLLENLNSLYAMTKLFGESLVRINSTVNYTTLRFGIVYGPRISPGSAVESIALKVYLNEEISVGSVSTSRRFIYIDDLVDGIVSVLKSDSRNISGKTFNLAGPELVSLDRIVQIANSVLNKNARIVSGDKSPSIRNPLVDEALLNLGWHPIVDLSTGIRECLSLMTKSRVKGLDC